VSSVVCSLSILSGRRCTRPFYSRRLTLACGQWRWHDTPCLLDDYSEPICRFRLISLALRLASCSFNIIKPSYLRNNNSNCTTIRRHGRSDRPLWIVTCQSRIQNQKSTCLFVRRIGSRTLGARRAHFRYRSRWSFILRALSCRHVFSPALWVRSVCILQDCDCHVAIHFLFLYHLQECVYEWQCGVL